MFMYVSAHTLLRSPPPKWKSWIRPCSHSISKAPWIFERGSSSRRGEVVAFPHKIYILDMFWKILCPCPAIVYRKLHDFWERELKSSKRNIGVSTGNGNSTQDMFWKMICAHVQPGISKAPWIFQGGGWNGRKVSTKLCLPSVLALSAPPPSPHK